MLYVIGNKTTEEFVANTGNYISSPPPCSQILSHISKETGIPSSGLSIYSADKDYTTRILEHDDYALVWSGIYDTGTSGIINTIVDLDFSVEDNKRQIVYETVEPDDESIRKSEILGDGIDFSKVMVRVYLPDMSDIDTSYNEELRIPFIDPDKRMAYAKVEISGGIGYKNFKTTKYGKWIIPNIYNYSGKNAKSYEGLVYDVDVVMAI